MRPPVRCQQTVSTGNSWGFSLLLFCDLGHHCGTSGMEQAASRVLGTQMMWHPKRHVPAQASSLANPAALLPTASCPGAWGPASCSEQPLAGCSSTSWSCGGVLWEGSPRVPSAAAHISPHPDLQLERVQAVAALAASLTRCQWAPVQGKDRDLQRWPFWAVAWPATGGHGGNLSFQGQPGEVR